MALPSPGFSTGLPVAVSAHEALKIRPVVQYISNPFRHER